MVEVVSSLSPSTTPQEDPGLVPRIGATKVQIKREIELDIRTKRGWQMIRRWDVVERGVLALARGS